MGFVIGIVIGIVIGVIVTGIGILIYAKRYMKTMTKEAYMKQLDRGAAALGAKFKDDPTSNAMDAWAEYRKEQE